MARRLSLLVLVALVALGALAVPAPAQGPTTGFEQRNGGSWTTFQEEQAFLSAVAAGSPRVRISVPGTTKRGRPLNLVEIGHPGPAGRDAALGRPTALMVCTQHGNEPAGREACLKLVRDLAFTSDAGLVSLMERTTFLFVPTANPDGREANSRGNSDGVDVNRDHLGLDTNEARAMAKVVLDWEPDVALDLHEYGPSQPVVYDDSVLWLWPRNLNTDKAVHDLAIEMGRRYLVPAANQAGYTTDEYGQAEVADNDVAQTAGDADEGIMRNAMGLRHSLGILVETRVDADVRQSPTEPADNAEVARRRVDSHGAVLRGMLRFMAERGAEAAAVTAAAARRKASEGYERSAPVYFGGADNQPPSASQVVNPPPCGYRLSDADVAKLGPRLELHGIEMHRLSVGPYLGLGQRAEPLIPLLVDRRGQRHVVEATPVSSDCPALPRPASEAPLGPPTDRDRRCVRPRTVLLRLPKVRRGKVVGVRVRANGRRVRVRRRVAYVRLRRPGSRVRVRIVQRVQFHGRVRVRRATRVFRVCRR